MKTQTIKNTSNNRLVIILASLISLLAIPLVAMQFTPEVNWTLSDFIVAGILLTSAGLALEFILRKVKTTPQRIIFCAILFFVFFLIWAELAVGIFGSPLAGN